MRVVAVAAAGGFAAGYFLPPYVFVGLMVGFILFVALDR